MSLVSMIHPDASLKAFVLMEDVGQQGGCGLVTTVLQTHRDSAEHGHWMPVTFRLFV